MYHGPTTETEWYVYEKTANGRWKKRLGPKHTVSGMPVTRESARSWMNNVHRRLGGHFRVIKVEKISSVELEV